MNKLWFAGSVCACVITAFVTLTFKQQRLSRNTSTELYKCALMEAELAHSDDRTRRSILIEAMPDCEALEVRTAEAQADPELKRAMLTEISRRQWAVLNIANGFEATDACKDFADCDEPHNKQVRERALAILEGRVH